MSVSSHSPFRPFRAAACAALAGVFAAPAPSQLQRWSDVSAAPWPVTFGALVHDPVRGSFVLYGGEYSGDTTWLLHESRWRGVATAERPRARYGHAMAFDAARGVTVLFGGLDASGLALSETWTFDGAAWRLMPVGTRPGPRTEHRLAFHAAANHVVLFGGALGTNDTWTWDGTAWAQRTGTMPQRRGNPAMAYDPTRQRTVLFGGTTTTTLLDDLWEWDGVAWSQRARAGTWPPLRAYGSLTFDATAGRCLWIGAATPTSASDAWHWDGVAWTPAPGPQVSEYVPLVAGDANGRIVMLGASPQPWLRENGTWRTAGPMRVNRSGHSMVFDPLLQMPLAFGGAGYIWGHDTMVHDGNDWLPLALTVQPPTRTGTAMSPFPARSSVLLFGGQQTLTTLGDTWEWSGSWTQRTPTTNPPARVGHRLATDTVRDRIVMFGGTGAGGLLPGTWEWDGNDWTLLGIPGPQARMWHAMAFDPLLRRVVLVGGRDWSQFLTDSWEFDGLQWTLLAASPPIQMDGLLAFDARRGALQYVVSTQIRGGVVPHFEYVNGQWAQLGTLAVPFPAHHGAVVFDERNGRLLLYGGALTLAAVDAVADVDRFGSPCTFGAAMPPSLTFLGRPALARPETTWRVDAITPGAVFALFADVQRAPLPATACLGWLPNPVVLAFSLASAAGAAELPVSIPQQPALLGFEVHAQAAAAGPNGIGAGIGVSAGVRVRVGN